MIEGLLTVVRKEIEEERPVPTLRDRMMNAAKRRGMPFVIEHVQTNPGSTAGAKIGALMGRGVKVVSDRVSRLVSGARQTYTEVAEDLEQAFQLDTYDRLITALDNYISDRVRKVYTEPDGTVISLSYDGKTRSYTIDTPRGEAAQLTFTGRFDEGTLVRLIDSYRELLYESKSRLKRGAKRFQSESQIEVAGFGRTRHATRFDGSTISSILTWKPRIGRRGFTMSYSQDLTNTGANDEQE